MNIFRNGIKLTLNKLYYYINLNVFPSTEPRTRARFTPDLHPNLHAKLCTDA